MPSLNLLGRLARRNRAFVLACAGIFLLFEFLVAAAVSTLNVEAMGAQIFATLPPMLQVMFGDQFATMFTSSGMLAFGWNHPIVLALGGAVAVMLGTRAIAAEVESGAIELVLAQPISRAAYFGTHVLFALLALALVACGGLAGSLLGESVYGLPLFHPAPALALTFNFWLLQSSFFGLALLLSSGAREAGRAGGAAFLLLLASFLMQAIGGLIKKYAFLLPWSLYERYLPRALLTTGRVPSASLAVLGGVLLLSLALAWWRFRRRDLP